MLHLGRISYGLYLLHSPVLWLFERYGIASRVNVSRATSVVYFGLVMLTTASVASISWFYFESPLNSLKRRFMYR